MMRRIILSIFSLTALAQNCELELAKLTAERLQNLQIEALTVRAEFEDYFAAVRKNVLEADYLIDVMELALIAEEHVMLVGPPGTAKTMVADLVLGGMRETVKQGDETITKPSYFSIQMTPETTMSETHGPFDYPKLSLGQYVRMLDQGMVMSRNVFIDEIFDGRANAQRNILQAINERRHTQGTHHTEGRIESALAATNFYQSQVYEKAGNDGPKAVFDRFAFVAFVPSEFEDIESDIALIQRAKRPKITVPQLHFENLEKIRALVSEVDIPDHVAEFLANISKRMKRETTNIEQAALRRHKEAIRDGEDPEPPYRSTKYHSKRTVQKAAGILKAMVVREWLRSGGKRPLAASMEDVEGLANFFCMNGPHSGFIQVQQAGSTDPHERAQMDTILNERKIFAKYYKEVSEEVNAVIVEKNDVFLEIQSQVLAPRTDVENAEIVAKLTGFLKEGLESSPTGGERIGHRLVREYVEENLPKVVSAEEAERILKAANTGDVAKLENESKLVVSRLDPAAAQREPAAPPDPEPAPDAPPVSEGIVMLPLPEVRTRSEKKVREFTYLAYKPVQTINKEQRVAWKWVPESRTVTETYTDIEDLSFQLDAKGKTVLEKKDDKWRALEAGGRISYLTENLPLKNAFAKDDHSFLAFEERGGAAGDKLYELKVSRHRGISSQELLEFEDALPYPGHLVSKQDSFRVVDPDNQLVRQWELATKIEYPRHFSVEGLENVAFERVPVAESVGDDRWVVFRNQANQTFVIDLYADQPQAVAGPAFPAGTRIKLLGVHEGFVYYSTRDSDYPYYKVSRTILSEASFPSATELVTYSQSRHIQLLVENGKARLAWLNEIQHDGVETIWGWHSLDLDAPLPKAALPTKGELLPGLGPVEIHHGNGTQPHASSADVVWKDGDLWLKGQQVAVTWYSTPPSTGRTRVFAEENGRWIYLQVGEGEEMELYALELREGYYGQSMIVRDNAQPLGIMNGALISLHRESDGARYLSHAYGSEKEASYDLTPEQSDRLEGKQVELGSHAFELVLRSGGTRATMEISQHSLR